MLPAEILNEIFLLALPHAKKGNFEALPTEDHTAVAVSQTCRLWRTVALHSSALWTEIFIQLLTVQDPQGDQDCVVTFPRLELVDLWLERSRERLLTIVIDGASSDWEHSQLLSRLLQEVHRWRNIDFQIGKLDSSVLTALQSPVSAPQLETFALRTNISLEGSDLSTALPSAIWKKSPLLRQFSLVASVTTYNAPDVPFTNWAHTVAFGVPYSRLTHLCIGGPVRGSEGLSVSEVISLLSLAGNLVSCIFTSVSNYTDPGVPSDLDDIETIHLERMENLSITANSRLRNEEAFPQSQPLSISSLLTCFSMPNLKSLLLADDEFWHARDLSVFLLLSECHLQELVLHVVSEVWEVFEHLTVCRGLTHLCLSEVWTAGEKFLWELVEYSQKIYKTDLRLLCPNLETLALAKEAYSAEAIANLVSEDMIILSNGPKRWPLKSLSIFDESLYEATAGEESTSQSLDLKWLDSLQPTVEVNILPVSDYTVQWVADFTGAI